MWTRIFFLIFLYCPASQAYPWMFFREDRSANYLLLDSHVSYFFKKPTTFFSGFQLNYHNSMSHLNAGYSYSFLENSHYFRVSELSVVFPFFWENWKMKLGFKDIVWSEADRYWNYGLWQARYLLDPLRPIQMGTPGVHFNYKTDKTSFLLSLSYFYVPDIIIYPKLTDNRISSKNPFFVDDIKWNVEKMDSLFQLENFLKPGLGFST